MDRWIGLLAAATFSLWIFSTIAIVRCSLSIATYILPYATLRYATNCFHASAFVSDLAK